MEENILNRVDVFSQLQQIFPCHSHLDIDDVINRLSSGHDNFHPVMINRCIDRLMKIKPKENLADGRYPKNKDELSTCQRQAVTELSQMFPDKSEPHIIKTVTHPRNSTLSYEVLFQRCLDALLEDNTEEENTVNVSDGSKKTENELVELARKLQQGSGSTGCIRDNSFRKPEYREPNTIFDSDEDSLLVGDKSGSSSGTPVISTAGPRSNSTRNLTTNDHNIDNLQDNDGSISVHTGAGEKTSHNTIDNDVKIEMNKNSQANVSSSSAVAKKIKQTLKTDEMKMDTPRIDNKQDVNHNIGVEKTPQSGDAYTFYRQKVSPEPINSSGASSSPNTPPTIDNSSDKLGMRKKTNMVADKGEIVTKKLEKELIADHEKMDTPVQKQENCKSNMKERITEDRSINMDTPVKLTIKSDPLSGFRFATPCPQRSSSVANKIESCSGLKDNRNTLSQKPRKLDSSMVSNKVQTLSSSSEVNNLSQLSTMSREQYKCSLNTENDRIKSVIHLDSSTSSSSSVETAEKNTPEKNIAQKNRNNSSDYRTPGKRLGELNRSKYEHKRKYMLMDLSSDSDSDEQTTVKGPLDDKVNEDLPKITIKSKDRDRFILSPAKKWSQQKKQDGSTSKSSFSQYRDKGGRIPDRMPSHTTTLPHRLPNTRFVAVGHVPGSPQGSQTPAHDTSLKSAPQPCTTEPQPGRSGDEDKPSTVLIESTCKITYSPNLFRNNQEDGIKQVPPVTIPSLIPHIPVLNNVPNVTHITAASNIHPATNTHKVPHASSVKQAKDRTEVDFEVISKQIQREKDIFNQQIAEMRNLLDGGRVTARTNKSTVRPGVSSTPTMAEAVPSTSKLNYDGNTNKDAVGDRKTIKDKTKQSKTDVAETVTVDPEDMDIGSDLNDLETDSDDLDSNYDDIYSDYDQDVLLDDELEVLRVEREVEVIDDERLYNDIQQNANNGRQPRQKQQTKGALKAQKEVIADLKNEVLQLFPDVDPGYLERLCIGHQGPMASNNICAILLDNQYPRKQVEGGATGSVESSKDEAIIDYFKYNQFKSIRDNMTVEELVNYKYQTNAVLNSKFPLISATDIKKISSMFEFSYAMTNQALNSVLKQAMEIVNNDTKAGKNTKLFALKFTAVLEKDSKSITVPVRLLKNRRYNTQLPKLLSPAVQKELDFVDRKLQERATEQDHEFAKQLNEQEYEAQGQCIECGCCYGEIPFDNMVQCLDGHLFCEDCLRQYARESVFGQGKAQLSCMTDGCTSAFPKNQLEKALPSDVLLRYEDRVAEESLNLADLGDLVRCPHCDFAAIMDPGDKVFSCMNNSCRKETCRHCKEEWSEHFGKKCEEIEKKDEVKLRLEYEEKMTKAKVRTCHRCKAQFTKEDGCNKMTCRCGAKMCYICRKPNIDYNHFCRHPRDPGKTCTDCDACSLWTNPEEDDNRAVSEIQKEAAEARKTKGYSEDKVIGVPEGQQGPPAKKMKT